jgi:GTP cyclohydrolase I
MFISNHSKEFSEEQKQDIIIRAAEKYKEFMEALYIDVDNDPNAKDTPMRVAKMLVNELWKGRYSAQPNIQSFPNTEKYDQMIFTNCEVPSVCSHHHVLINNKVFIGVLTNPDSYSRLIGLSKYTRIVEWIASRPTIQEDMTQQIHDEINRMCRRNLGIMVYVIGQHGCTVSRGVKQSNSKMITSSLSGFFKEKQSCKDEFMNMIKNVLGDK